MERSCWSVNVIRRNEVSAYDKEGKPHSSKHMLVSTSGAEQREIIARAEGNNCQVVLVWDENILDE